MKNKERIGLYAGSFNPFTAGHADIASRALTVFDRVVIAVGVNKAKPACAGDPAEPIRRLYAAEPRIEVRTFDGLTANLAAELGATLVRGVRGVRDFEYERDMADINRRLTGVDTVVFFASPELGAVSSSVVRELQAFGADVTPFMPHN